MTAKEKAQELINKFDNAGVESCCYTSEIMQKKCALIAVDEIMIAIDWDNIPPENKDDWWDEVKQEIEL